MYRKFCSRAQPPAAASDPFTLLNNSTLNSRSLHTSLTAEVAAHRLRRFPLAFGPDKQPLYRPINRTTQHRTTFLANGEPCGFLPCLLSLPPSAGDCSMPPATCRPRR